MRDCFLSFRIIDLFGDANIAICYKSVLEKMALKNQGRLLKKSCSSFS